MSLIGKKLLNQALTLLEETIRLGDYPAQHFVVCGGSSLLALELVNRTATRDVDILATLDDGQLIPAKPLPDWVIAAAEEIRAELDLPEDWLNTGPADDSFFTFGFPDGIEERLTTQTFGPYLSVSFISRYDQIFFKLYAATNQDVGRHFTDLRELKPTREELLAAARWTCLHDPSEGFRYNLGEILSHLGHADLAQQL